MEDRSKTIEQIKLLRELQRRKARKTLRDFLPYINPKYQTKWFHREIADACQALFEGLWSKIMISVPPQHGKSLIASTYAPAWGLGIDPDLKIVDPTNPGTTPTNPDDPNAGND